MFFQNYDGHLKRFHPSENPSDLRGYGQLKFLFSPKKNADSKPEEENEEEVERRGEVI